MTNKFSIFSILILLLSTCFSSFGQEKLGLRDLDRSNILDKEILQIELAEPTHTDPVSVGAMLVPSEDSSMRTLVIKVKIKVGYHIYAYVSPKDPYIKSETGFELPQGVIAIGEWKKPPPAPYPGKEGLLIYTDELEFKQDIKIDGNVKEGSTIKCWLYYQCCDVNICFPPQEKEVKIKI